MRFNPNYTRPWSVANTPVILNPRKAGLVPVAEGINELMEIIESPVPWRYVESGFVLWEGPSPVDGAPLVAIVTGIKPSQNVKTGAMLQTWILRSDISPQEAVDTGGDRSICGDCKHRGFRLEKPKRKLRRMITAEEAVLGFGIAGGPPTRIEYIEQVMGGRACYVVVAQAPMAVWKAYRRGDVYPHMPPEELPLLGYNRVVRLGSYGDPAMVPEGVWRALTWDSLGWTGYTHQWCEPGVQALRPFVMASVDNERELHQAQSMGWRTFRVLRGDEQLIAGLELTCPASAEGEHLKTCDACRLCQGVMPGRAPWRERPDVPSVAIKVHPRFQILYYPRGKKGKKIRAHKVTDRPTKLDPRKKPSEIVLVDYLAQSEAAGVNKLMKKAENSGAPRTVIEAARHEFPDYLQSYFDVAPEILASRGTCLPVLNNPTAAQLQRLIFLKIEELDDAKYFKRPKAEIKKLGDELSELEGQLVGFAQAFEADVRRGMATTRQGIERAEWQYRHMRRNPLLAIVGMNPTKAESLLKKAVRPCMTREEALVAAQSIERSLGAIERQATIRGTHRRGILQLLWWARTAKKPKERIRWLTQANDMLQVLKVRGPGTRKIAPVKDPRLGHLLGIAANPYEYQLNPLLAIVGNPGPPGRGLDHHRRAALDLIYQAIENEDFGPLRQAHEHLQAAYRCCSNPPNPEELGVLDEVLAEIDVAEGVLFAGLEKAAGYARKAVAGSGKRGRVKGKRARKRKKKPVRKNKAPRKKRYSLDEARKKFEGFDEALKSYRRFHDREPGHVDVYELNDGSEEVTVDRVHSALHRTLETNYIVPWDSNKQGSLWKHEHIEGALKGDVDLDARAEDLPLEVYDPRTKSTRKFGGRFYITDWWREKSGSGEHRNH